MPTEISIPLYYVVPVVLGFILAILNIRKLWNAVEVILRWLGRNFATVALVIFCLSVVTAFAVPMYKSYQRTALFDAEVAEQIAESDRCAKNRLLGRKKQRAADDKAKIEAHLHAVLPGRWMALHTEICRINYWDAKIAVIERFVEKYAKDEPRLPPEGLDKFLHAFNDKHVESSNKRIRRARDMLYPYMDFVVP